MGNSFYSAVTVAQIQSQNGTKNPLLLLAGPAILHGKMSKLLLIDDEEDVRYSIQRIFDSPEIELATTAILIGASRTEIKRPVETGEHVWRGQQAYSSHQRVYFYHGCFLH